MADLYLTDEASLRAMIDRWLEAREVVGPKRTAWGDVLLESLDGGAECTLDFEIPVVPPKEWLLPQVETLFVYETDAPTRVHESPDSTPRVLFGVRPCDVAGLAVLEEAMGGPLADHYFAVRRENTACVALACDRVFDGHFCHLFGTGPALGSLFDWQVTPLGGAMAVEVAGERGRLLLEPVRDLVSEAGPQVRKDLARRHDEARRSGPDLFDAARLRDVLGGRQLQEAVLEGLFSRCLSCGGCSFLCPSCGCFTLVDVRAESGAGERQRRWDTCAFAAFTSMAGGDNPTGGRPGRVARRLRHKFACADRPACVGCGRCVTACLGNARLPEILKRLLDVSAVT